MPALYCNTDIYPDYIALYSERKQYNKTAATAVSFYQFDDAFDGEKGLYNAIYYNNTNLLQKYISRFKNVRIFISPDYSELGDVHIIESYYRLFKARIVSLWLSLEIGSIVIPNISFATNAMGRIALSGLENCSVIAVSTKGHISEPNEYNRLKENIRFIVDNLSLKAIIVYDVCKDNTKTLSAFSYAMDKGIKIVLPNNTLKTRNMSRKAVTV